MVWLPWCRVALVTPRQRHLLLRPPGNMQRQNPVPARASQLFTGGPWPCEVWAGGVTLGRLQRGLQAFSGRPGGGDLGRPCSRRPGDSSYLLKCSPLAKWEPSHYPPSWQRELGKERERDEPRCHQGMKLTSAARQVRNDSRKPDIHWVLSKSLEASVKNQHSACWQRREYIQRVRVACQWFYFLLSYMWVFFSPSIISTLFPKYISLISININKAILKRTHLQMQSNVKNNSQSPLSNHQ